MAYGDTDDDDGAIRTLKVTCDVVFTGESTDKAYEVYMPKQGPNHKFFIPFSHTDSRHGKLSGGPGKVVVTRWIAKEKKMI